ncbi:FHA domain-containing serine/threonine-protein kinase [Allobaculum mucilyticum]|uniref:FHA domain-containing serine/threonine-protein kinase n=1 Tax=Allobaculum mucilyticum TaxID=2834459 RepID=UPI001E4A8DAD|nr:FHA domain-containing serine/threonine-protein kinase [Allobaculum mucilyticum]UNT97111.1 protein kinase [Allobaculum mucilyticum]
MIFNTDQKDSSALVQDGQSAANDQCYMPGSGPSAGKGSRAMRRYGLFGWHKGSRSSESSQPQPQIQPNRPSPSDTVLLPQSELGPELSSGTSDGTAGSTTSQTGSINVGLRFIGSPEKKEFPGPRVVLGREGDFFVTDPKRTVSRVHAEITWNKTRKKWVLLDRSANGTFLNGKRIVSGTAAPLKNGDRIRLACAQEIEIFLPKTSEEKLPPEIMNDKQMSLNGRTLRGIRVLNEIGRGGFSKVYVAVTPDDQLICIKHLAGKGATPQNLQEFIDSINSDNPPMFAEHQSSKLRISENEYSMVSQFRHPGILHVFEKFAAPEHIMIFMELLDGPTLHQMINDVRRIDPLLVTDISIQIASILAYLHTLPRPVVYRDLKPINLIITRDEKVHLLDFGISEYYVPGQADANPCHTEGYSAPEQDNQHSTPLSDLYSLGVTMFVALTGRSVTRLKNAKPPYHPGDYVAVPHELDQVIARLTEPNPAMRFQSANEVVQALLDVQYRIGKPGPWFSN